MKALKVAVFVLAITSFVYFGLAVVWAPVLFLLLSTASLPPALIDLVAFSGDNFEGGMGLAPSTLQGWVIFSVFYAVIGAIVAFIARTLLRRYRRAA